MSLTAGSATRDLCYRANACAGDDGRARAEFGALVGGDQRLCNQLSARGFAGGDSKHLPFLGNAFELMTSAVFEHEAGAG